VGFFKLRSLISAFVWNYLSTLTHATAFLGSMLALIEELADLQPQHSLGMLASAPVP